MSVNEENLFRVEMAEPLLQSHELQRDEPVENNPPAAHTHDVQPDQNRGQTIPVRPHAGHLGGHDGQYPTNPDLRHLARQIDGGQAQQRYPINAYNYYQGGPQNNPYSYPNQGRDQNQSMDRMFPERPDVLIQNAEPMDARPQNPHFHPKPFLLHEKLGPFVTPTGPATINIDRLQPYLDYLSVRIPKDLESTAYKLYFLWIWLYVSLTLIPVVLLYVGAYENQSGYNFVAIPIQMMASIHWAAGIYQAHYVQESMKSKDKKRKNIGKALEIMKFYLMGIIVMIAIMIGCAFSGLAYGQNCGFILWLYFFSFVLEAVLNYYVAMKIEKHLKKVERFQELIQDKLQDREKTGIFYRYVYELLELISDEDFLYPIKDPKKEKKSNEEMFKAISEGIENVAHIIEAQNGGHAA